MKSFQLSGLNSALFLTTVMLALPPTVMAETAAEKTPTYQSVSAASSAGTTEPDWNDTKKPTSELDSPTPILQGGVKHSETLPGLDANLRPGQVYRDELLMKPGTETKTQWYYVPAWYAGSRHSEYCVIMYRLDYASGSSTTPMLKQLNRQDSLSGFQRDKNGGIWDFKKVPQIQHLESDMVDAVLYVRKITPIAGSEERLVIKYEEISISFEKRSKKILLVVQQEQINTVTSPQPGVLHIDVSVKSFNWDGTPQRLEQSVIMAKITEPFEVIDEYEGQDLRPLFRDYLMTHDLQNLVPDNLKK